MLNDIPLYGGTIVFFFLILSLMEEHLGGFLVLAIMNKAAINISSRFLCGPKFSTP